MESNHFHPRYCFAKDPGWADWHFDVPLEAWDAARATLVREDGVEPHITAFDSVSHSSSYFIISDSCK